MYSQLKADRNHLIYESEELSVLNMCIVSCILSCSIFAMLTAQSTSSASTGGVDLIVCLILNSEAIKKQPKFGLNLICGKNSTRVEISPIMVVEVSLGCNSQQSLR